MESVNPAPDERPSQHQAEAMDEGASTWEGHKSTIHALYIGRNLTLHSLIKEMENLHNFSATKAQYERRLTKWGFKKNRKKRDWVEIAEKVIGRLNDSGDQEVMIGDEAIPLKKLKKEVRRYRHLINPVSVESTGTEQLLDGNQSCSSTSASQTASPSTANHASSSSFTLIRSPRFQFRLPQIMSPSFDHLKADSNMYGSDVFRKLHMNFSWSDVDTKLSPNVFMDSGFLRPQPFSHDLEQQGSMKELLRISSPLNNILKAAMAPSDYRDLMSSVDMNQAQLSSSTRSKLIYAASFVFRNSISEDSLDLGHQMFTWFRANYDPKVFRSLAGNKDPVATAILDKFFQRAVWEGDSDMVYELLLIGVNPDQRWCPPSSDHPTPLEARSGLDIACQKHPHIAKLLLDSGASVPLVMNSHNAPIYHLLEGDSPLDWNLVEQLFEATPDGQNLTGCLESAIRRNDLRLVELLVKSGRDRTNNLFLLYPQVTFPVLKTLFLAKSHCYLASMSKNPVSRYNYYSFLNNLLSLMVNQKSYQGIRFLLDAGVCFSTQSILALCGIPDLRMISELLLDSALSLGHMVHDERLSFILANLPTTASLVPEAMPNNAAPGDEENHDVRRTIAFTAMAQKIAEILKKLPVGIIERCSQELVRNPLWRSLQPHEWPDYKDAFEVILRTRGSNIDSFQAYLLIAAKSRDTAGLYDLLDATVICSTEALEELLQEVIQWGNIEVLKRIIDELSWARRSLSTGIDQYPGYMLRKAILTGDLAIVEALTSAGVTFDPGIGLMEAVSQQRLEIVEHLLRSGEDSNMICRMAGYCHSPLAQALASKNMDIARLLIRYGANPHDDEALFYASENSLQVLDTLLLLCQKDFLVHGGVRALLHAIQHSRLDIIMTLMKYGVDCNAMTQATSTTIKTSCFGAAIQLQDSTVLESILGTGIDVNVIVERQENHWSRLSNAYTALAKAVECQNSNAIRILLEAGASLNPTVTPTLPELITPLRAATDRGNVDLMEKLLDSGADPNQDPNPYGGLTVLQVAASKGLIGAAAVLLCHGADVNAPGARRGGLTALEAAAENGRIDMIPFLVKSGAFIGPGSTQYQNALSRAVANRNHAVCEMLEILYQKEIEQTSSTIQISELLGDTMRSHETMQDSFGSDNATIDDELVIHPQGPILTSLPDYFLGEDTGWDMIL